jgi:hypothetical protein
LLGIISHHLFPAEATDPADIQTSIEAKGQLQRHCGASAICATGKGWGWDFASENLGTYGEKVDFDLGKSRKNGKTLDFAMFCL